jgi:hypothetical protein
VQPLLVVVLESVCRPSDVPVGPDQQRVGLEVVERVPVSSYLPDGQLTLSYQIKNLTAGRLRQHCLVQDHLRHTSQKPLETRMTTLPRRFRQLLPAAVLAAALATGANIVGSPAIASAERVWDIENFDDCMAGLSHDQMNYSLNEQKLFHQKCCEYSGGIFIDDGYVGKCVAPPAEPTSQGTQQLPGNVQIPSDIATAPVVTQAPRARIPSGIATAPTVTAP